LPYGIDLKLFLNDNDYCFDYYYYMEHSMSFPPARQSASRFSRTTLALAITTAISPPVFSQENTNTYGTPEEIEITSRPYERDPASVKFTRPLLDTAQTVNVISENLISERNATTLRDVLRNVSGISMQASEGGTPAGDQLSIRGHSARTDIFVDNAIRPSPWAGRFARTCPPPFFYQNRMTMKAVNY
jgi:outer membrane receptor for monomeric catechols